MANRRNGGRKRNSGGTYARPIPEPCNFVEFDIDVGSGAEVITHATLNAALLALVPVASVSKYRVSSLVIEPIASPSSIPGGAELQLGISGNEYLFNSSTRPLKVRTGKTFGSDGMWIVLDGAALTDAALPGNETTADPFLSVNLPSIVTSWSSTVHFRVAWQDPS